MSILVSLDVDARTVAPGGRLHLVTAWHAAKRNIDFRVLVVLASGNVRTVSALPPGYDWYESKDWKNRETIETRHWVDVPADFPLGATQLGIVVLDTATGLPIGGAAGEAIPGTWWSDEALGIVPPADASTARQAGLGESLVLADHGACADAWLRFKRASRHVARDTEWIDTFAPIVREAEARCWLARASGSDADSIAAMQAAVATDGEVSADAARPMAQALDRKGDEATAAGSWRDAYDDYLAAIRIDPTLAATRKKLEHARDERLGLPEESREPQDDADEARAGE